MGIFSKKVNDELLKLIEADENKNPTGFTIDNGEDTKIKPSHAITVSEVLDESSDDDKLNISFTKSPLEALKDRMMNRQNDNENTQDKKEPVKKEEPTLLQKCKPYIVDENGKDATTPKEPLYRLESVAEILENDSNDVIDRLAKQYGIKLGELVSSDTSKTANTENIEDSKNESFEEEVKINSFQTSLPDISDIDNYVSKQDEADEPEADGATIRFTPVKEATKSGETVTFTTSTHTIDLSEELQDLVEADVMETKTLSEENEFESFSSKEEATNPADIKRLIYSLSVKKRNAFLRMVISVFITILLLLCEIPPLSDLMLSKTKAMMIVCSAIFGVLTIINADMFLSLKNIFNRRLTSDIAATFAALSTLSYSIISAINSSVGYELVVLCSVILSFRAISQFLSRSAMLGNLRQAVSSLPKKAVTFISDEATTFAMAKNAIEGDVLVATPRDTENVTDFMKYSTFGVFMNGKLPIITIISLCLSVLAGVISMGIFGEITKALYSFAAILCITALPTVFLSEALPLSSAAKKLNAKGAMIAGKIAAERLQMANAIVLNSNDIFPEGSLILHDINVLSSNSIDDTILKAASLTDAIGSPLSSIFKQIAVTNSSYSIPDSDTVKYEERLGISGWVDDELLFIGNRTLMEAHGIKVPDIKVDRKILSEGYFPVYIASGNKAMALVVVRYTVNKSVVYELKKITEAGVTVLVNNCDPNMTAEMICDYLGLYEDSVKVMSNAGVHMYKNAVPPTESCSAPAVFRGSKINFLSLMNKAAKIKKSIFLLNFLYLIFLCVGLLIFAYLSFSGGDSPLSPQTLTFYELGSTALSIIIYQFFKP